MREPGKKTREIRHRRRRPLRLEETKDEEPNRRPSRYPRRRHN